MDSMQLVQATTQNRNFVAFSVAQQAVSAARVQLSEKFTAATYEI
jgi:hypothetical protein